MVKTPAPDDEEGTAHEEHVVVPIAFVVRQRPHTSRPAAERGPAPMNRTVAWPGGS